MGNMLGKNDLMVFNYFIGILIIISNLKYVLNFLKN